MLQEENEMLGDKGESEPEKEKKKSDCKGSLEVIQTILPPLQHTFKAGLIHIRFLRTFLCF